MTDADARESCALDKKHHSQRTKQKIFRITLAPDMIPVVRCDNCFLCPALVQRSRRSRRSREWCGTALPLMPVLWVVRTGTCGCLLSLFLLCSCCSLIFSLFLFFNRIRIGFLNVVVVVLEHLVSLSSNRKCKMVYFTRWCILHREVCYSTRVIIRLNGCHEPYFLHYTSAVWVMSSVILCDGSAVTDTDAERSFAI